mmetsp:Transcript_30124/g.66253  ORF Transcript_30124/g.66253 Transcript_30124/m.66253 type:complete len:254 (-) Transcript_30124:88-849(-)
MNGRARPDGFPRIPPPLVAGSSSSTPLDSFSSSTLRLLQMMLVVLRLFLIWYFLHIALMEREDLDPPIVADVIVSTATTITTNNTTSPTTRIRHTNSFVVDVIQHLIIRRPNQSLGLPPSRQVIIKGPAAQGAPVRCVLRNGVQIFQHGTRSDPHPFPPSPGFVNVSMEKVRAHLVPEQGGYIPNEEGARPVLCVGVVVVVIIIISCTSSSSTTTTQSRSRSSTSSMPRTSSTITGTRTSRRGGGDRDIFAVS